MRNIVFIILMMSSLITQAQEDIFLHFDKNFYVLGEQIWLSAYLQKQMSAEHEAQQIRVIIMDKNGEVKERTILSVQDNHASGTIAIPLDWEDGWYTLHAFTVLNPNPTIKNLTSVAIPIYNDFKSYKLNGVMPRYNEREEKVVFSDIKTSQSNYNRRETVNVDLALKDAMDNGIFSVAVVSKAMLDELPRLHSKRQTFETTDKQKPEESNTLYGQLIKNNNDKKNLGVGVYFLKDNQLQWQSTDASGIFMVQNRLGSEQSIQVFGMFTNQGTTYTTPLSAKVIDFSTNLKPIEPSTALPVNKYIQIYLKQSQQRKKYQEIFGVERVIYMQLDSNQNAFQPDLSYVLSEYTSMTSLEEFMQEVIPFIKIKTKKGTQKVSIFNEEKEFYKNNPVYMVDGWLTYDQASIFKIPIEEVESISVFRKRPTLRSQFGILGQDGVISIQTKKQDYTKGLENAPNVLTSISKVNQANFKASSSENKNIPNFESLIFWSDNVKVNNGKASFSFQHTDDLGEFTIIIKGIADDGRIIIGQASYQVK